MSPDLVKKGLLPLAVTVLLIIIFDLYGKYSSQYIKNHTFKLHFKLHSKD